MSRKFITRKFIPLFPGRTAAVRHAASAPVLKIQQALHKGELFADYLAKRKVHATRPLAYDRALHSRAPPPLASAGVALAPALTPPAGEIAGAAAAAAAEAMEKAAVATAAATASTTGMGFWRFALVFTLGGLFFSTVLATVGAVYTFGRGNVQQAVALALQVANRVWKLATRVLSKAWSILFGKEEARRLAERWSAAWAVLRTGFVEARQTASEGVSAFRDESSLIAAMVGAPGLQISQYIVDRLMPFALGAAIGDAFEESLKEAAAANPRIKQMKLRKFDAGCAAPRLLAARAYELGSDAIAFDVDMMWQSEIEVQLDVVGADIVGARLPVSLKNVRFDGPIRVVATPLIDEPPGFGALLLSVPGQPRINMDIKVAGGELTKLPWLRSEVEKVIRKVIDDNVLWPRRLVVPMDGPNRQPLLSCAQLQTLREGDPLLAAERGIAERPAALEREREATPADIKISVDDMAAAMAVAAAATVAVVTSKSLAKGRLRAAFAAIRAVPARGLAMLRPGAANSTTPEPAANSTMPEPAATVVGG